ncbi:hypothetical protein IAT40_005758 [Kwoniella sp. CBS 6097]
MPELFEWPCQYPGCDVLVLRQGAICNDCFEVCCDDHRGKDVHPCRNLRAMLEALWEKLRAYQDEMRKEVSRHRPGHHCVLNIPEPGAAKEALESWRSHMLGACNVNFIISFDDEVKWILRVRQDENHRLPRIIREANIRSEVTTLNLLKANGVPVAAAWLPSHPESRDPSCPDPPFDYFFTEFLEGKPWFIHRFDWEGVLEVVDHELEDFIDQYALQQIRLSEICIPTNQIGCLTTTADGEVVAGPIIARGAFMSPRPPYLFGPFSNMQERYLAHIRAALDYAAVGALSRYDEPIDVYLWHLELEELVMNCMFLSEKPDEVFIKHDDDKGDVYLFDEHDQICGILDWEWAFVTTKGEAFAAHESFYDVRDYMRDSNKMTPEENMLISAYEKYQRLDLADCVRNGRIFQRLSRIGRYTYNYWKDGFRQVFGENPLPDFDPPTGREDDRWRLYMMKRYKNHQGLKEAMVRFGWTIKRAEEEIPRGDERKREQEKRLAMMKEREKGTLAMWKKAQEEKAKGELPKGGGKQSADGKEKGTEEENSVDNCLREQDKQDQDSSKPGSAKSLVGLAPRGKEITAVVGMNPPLLPGPSPTRRARMNQRQTSDQSN